MWDRPNPGPTNVAQSGNRAGQRSTAEVTGPTNVAQPPSAVSERQAHPPDGSLHYIVVRERARTDTTAIGKLTECVRPGGSQFYGLLRKRPDRNVLPTDTGPNRCASVEQTFLSAVPMPHAGVFQHDPELRQDLNGCGTAALR